jgi:class 3 adenylate cyclase/predicted ATPase
VLLQTHQCTLFVARGPKLSHDRALVAAMQEIADWLKKLGMAEYAQRFVENRIDLSVLPELTDQDLEKMGVLLGDRRKMLRAIRDLGNTAVAVTAPSGPVATESPGRDEAERRQLTVMFCDLVGSTALSANLDPEDLRSIITAYHRCCSEQVERHDGFVAKYMGDGVLAYFGYPKAHEHDAERAVRAGLALVKAVPKLATTAGSPLQVRIGIATGLVVVGDLIGAGAAREQTVVGETPNLAARLQALTEPGTVMIAAGTRRLTSGLFEYRELGSVSVKGFGDPVQVWNVIGASAVESRFEALRTATTPLVGREEEIELLLRRWGQAKAGDGQVVLISGEPGIGKSRVAQRVVERLSGDPHTRMRYFCSPHHQDSALHPSIAQLERAAGFRREDTDEQRLAKLEAVLSEGTNDLSEAVPLLADLLSIPAGDCYPPLNLTPQKRKEKTLHAQVAQVEGLAARQPVLMVWEDVHWSDPTTRESLDLLIDRIPTLRVLLIITFRPEYTPPWIGLPHVAILNLNRLSKRQRAEMMTHVGGGKTLPKEIADQIVDRTDGVPLFIEELTKAVVESGVLTESDDRYTVTGPVGPLAIPTTLHGSLLARLDRLVPTREVAQIGAALGRSFSHELISAVATMPKQQLDDALAQLIDAELIFRRGTPPDAEYTFKHALVQDAAYSTLLRGPREFLHGRIADALLAAKVPTTPEIIAHHLQSAGRVTEAIGYWRKAGEQAVRRAANREGIEHFRRALSFVEVQPEAAERWRTELAILSQLTPALMSVHGWSAQEVGEAVERATGIGRLLESATDLAPSVANLWLYNYSQARFDRVDAISADLFRMAGQLEDRGILLQAHHCAWPTFWRRGGFLQASEHIDAGLKLYDEERHAHHRNVYLGHDPAVCGLAIKAPVQDALGYLDGALRCEREAVALARRLAHAPSLAHALWLACEAGAARGDAEGILAPAAELLKLSEEHGLSQPRASALILLGWALARSGDAAQGIVKLEEGLGVMKQLGIRMFLPRSLCLMAEALSAGGRLVQGLQQLARGLDIAVETGDVVYVPRLHQTRAELLLYADRAAGAAAEASLQQALTVARQQGAKGYELRSAIGLARLWRDQNKRTEARDLLTPIYNWFTEGFDTRVLQEAKVLLDELG